MDLNTTSGEREATVGLPDRICDPVLRWAEVSPDQPALVDGSGPWSYGELVSAIQSTRDWLRSRGVRPGDRVVLVCENCRAFVAFLLALASFDAWAALVNARLSAREVDEIREHCGARLVIYMTAVSSHAAQHAKRHNATVENVPMLREIGVSAINENTSPEPLEAEAGNNVAVLIYTSGTTGVPKGVMLTHSNLLFMATVSAGIRKLAPNDRLYGVLPMSHAVGLSVVLLGALVSGASVYLISRFDPLTARASIERDGITIMLGVPSTFSQLLDYAKLRGLSALPFPALRIISSSGAPLHADLKAKVEQMFALPLHNGYGVTECSPTIAQANVDVRRTDTSVGEILPGTHVMLVEPGTNRPTNDDIGELWVRGPHVMKGYYRAAEETARAVNADGWFNTRDLARLEGRNLFIVGRTKELIVRFGFNVYPAEVEAVLNTHEQVVRSAVIGRTVEGKGGEEVIAFVQVAQHSSLSANDIARFAAQHLAPYKQPTHIFVLPELPLTPTGKVAKNELAKSLETLLQPN